MYMFPIVLETQLRGQWTWWIPNFCIKFWIWASWIPLTISVSCPIYLLLLLPLIHGTHACGSSSTNCTKEMCFIYFKMYLKESIETFFLMNDSLETLMDSFTCLILIIVMSSWQVAVFSSWNQWTTSVENWAVGSLTISSIFIQSNCRWWTTTLWAYVYIQEWLD